MKKYGQADVMCAVIHMFLEHQKETSDIHFKGYFSRMDCKSNKIPKFAAYYKQRKIK